MEKQVLISKIYQSIGIIEQETEKVNDKETYVFYKKTLEGIKKTFARVDQAKIPQINVIATLVDLRLMLFKVKKLNRIT